MRIIQTFIAHILWDDEEPEILRGSLRNVTSDLVQTFANQQELISLLQGIMRYIVEGSLPNPTEEKIEKNSS